MYWLSSPKPFLYRPASVQRLVMNIRVPVIMLLTEIKNGRIFTFV